MTRRMSLRSACVSVEDYINALDEASWDEIADAYELVTADRALVAGRRRSYIAVRSVRRGGERMARGFRRSVAVATLAIVVAFSAFMAATVIQNRQEANAQCRDTPSSAVGACATRGPNVWLSGAVTAVSVLVVVVPVAAGRTWSRDG
jgi:hypothetical protein